MDAAIETNSDGKWFWGITLIIAAILVSLPDLSAHHMFAGPDLMFHLNRIEGMKDALLAGQFPVRINAYQLGGYGAPTDIFYPDLFLYFPACLRLLGVSLTTSWRAFLVLVNFLTVFSCWWIFSAYTRSVRTGAIASLFYLVFAYRIVEEYVVLAAGSIVAQAFLPAACLSVWMVLRRRVSYWPAAVLFSTGVLQSHIISSLLLLIAVLAMVLVSLPQFRFREVRRAAGKAASFIALLNLWFYAPMLYFHRHMDYVMKHVASHDISQAIFPFFSSDFYMGSGMLLLLAAVVVRAACHWRKMPRSFWWMLFLGAAVMVLMLSPQAWRWIGKAGGVLQFTARLAVFPAFLLSLALAMGLASMRRTWILLVLVFLCWTGNLLWLLGSGAAIPPHPRPQAREDVEKGIFLKRTAITNVVQEFERETAGVGCRDYLDVGVSQRLKEADDIREKVKDRAVRPDDRIETVERRGTSLDVTYRAGQETWLQLPLFWYMGYAAEDQTGGTAVPMRKDEDGQVSVQLPPSAGTVHVRYAGLGWFHGTDLLSWFGWTGFLYMAYRSRQESRKRENQWKELEERK